MLELVAVAHAKQDTLAQEDSDLVASKALTRLVELVAVSCANQDTLALDRLIGKHAFLPLTQLVDLVAVEHVMQVTTVQENQI